MSLLTYSTGEVKWLVEHYQDKCNAKPNLLIKYVDLANSYSLLPRSTREIMFMVGVLGMDQATVGFLLDQHRNTISRQYKEGLKTLTQYMNMLPTEEGDYEWET